VQGASRACPFTGSAAHAAIILHIPGQSLFIRTRRVAAGQFVLVESVLHLQNHQLTAAQEDDGILSIGTEFMSAQRDVQRITHDGFDIGRVRFARAVITQARIEVDTADIARDFPVAP